MPILASKLQSTMAAALDAEDSDAYLFSRDYMPAINYAIDELVRLINNKMGSDSFTEYALKELRFAKIFQTNAYSRCAIPNTIWSIVAVHPEPVTIPANPSIVVLPYPESSIERTDVALGPFQSFTAKRFTSGEWSRAIENPMSDAYSVAHPMRQYGYLEVWNHWLTEESDNQYHNVGAEITISPAQNKKLLGLRVIINPTKITADTDYVQFPEKLFNIIVNLGLLFIAYKQGDKTNVYGISMEQLQQEILNFS